MDKRWAAAERQRVEVAIAGGGLTGLALAAALGRTGARLALVEQTPLARSVEPEHDGRVTAVARGTRRFLASIGAWAAIEPDAEPVAVGFGREHSAAGTVGKGRAHPEKTPDGKLPPTTHR